MEVSLPRSVFPNELDFSDLNVLTNELEENKAGYYSKNLANFLKYKMRRLRFDFLPDRHNTNRRDYIRVFYSSSSLVKNTLEQIWFTKSEFMDWKTKLLNVEKVISKFQDSKKEMEALPWWQRVAFHLHLNMRPDKKAILKMLEETKHNMDLIQDDLMKMVGSYNALAYRTSKDIQKLMTIFKADNSDGDADGRDIAGKLRSLLIEKQLYAMMKELEGVAPWLMRVLIIRRSIGLCKAWIQKELQWNEVCSKGNHWNCNSAGQVEKGTEDKTKGLILND